MSTCKYKYAKKYINNVNCRIQAPVEDASDVIVDIYKKHCGIDGEYI
jgi:hypothetical protein